jgi:hypothetical protein
VDSVVTTTTTRVAAFRAQKRRLQMKRRRRVAALISGITMVGGFRMYLRQQPLTSYPTQVETNVTTRDDFAWMDHYSFLENETMEETRLDLLSEEELEEILDILHGADMFCDIDEDELSQQDISNADKGEGRLDYVVDTQNTTDMGAMSENNINNVDSGVLLVRKCKNFIQGILNRIFGRMPCQTDRCWEKRCKNIVQRIFNQRCRVRARQRYEKGSEGATTKDNKL